MGDAPPARPRVNELTGRLATLVHTLADRGRPSEYLTLHPAFPE